MCQYPHLLQIRQLEASLVQIHRRVVVNRRRRTIGFLQVIVLNKYRDVSKERHGKLRTAIGMRGGNFAARDSIGVGLRQTAQPFRDRHQAVPQRGRRMRGQRDGFCSIAECCSWDRLPVELETADVLEHDLPDSHVRTRLSMLPACFPKKFCHLYDFSR